MTARPLADCAQVAHDAEASHVVGDGTLLTTGEAATIMRVSKSTVHKLIRTKQIAATTVPGSTHLRIARKVAEDWRDRMDRETAGDA